MKSFLRRMANRLVRLGFVQYRTVTVPVVSTQAFSGASVLVAGGGRVGSAVAKAFLDAGARVQILDQRTGCAPPGALEYAADLGDPADIERAWARLEHPVDILVHAAGYQPKLEHFDAQAPGEWGRCLDVNVLGLMTLTQLFGKAQLARGAPGNVVLIASIHHELTGGWAAYSASKAAIVAFMREVALEWAAQNIRVNAVAPGWVADPNEGNAHDFPHMPLHSKAIPAEQVANAVVFLCSDLAAFVTGTVLTVDGGLSLRSYRTPAQVPKDDPHIRRYRDA